MNGNDSLLGFVISGLLTVAILTAAAYFWLPASLGIHWASITAGSALSVIVRGVRDHNAGRFYRPLTGRQLERMRRHGHSEADINAALRRGR